MGAGVAVGARIVAVTFGVLVVVDDAVGVGVVVGDIVGVAELVGVGISVEVLVAVDVSARAAIGVGVAVLAGKMMPARTPEPNPAPKTKRPSVMSAKSSDRCPPLFSLLVFVLATGHNPR